MNDTPEKIIYEYCLLRYVPDLERGEFVNVGLMMMSKRHRWMRVGLHVDKERIERLSPKADITRLRTQLGAFSPDGVPFPDLAPEERYRWMAAVKSAIIQTSPSHPGILIAVPACGREDARRMLDSKFDELLDRLVK
jgi:hypothetical protein